MQTLLLKNVVLDGRKVNILIEGNAFKDIDVPEGALADSVIDAEGKAIVPSLVNAHTHSAMMPMRGYGDDTPLHVWLQDYVWPYENKMTPADMHSGYELALREMISSGTTTFNDMYFEIEQLIDLLNTYPLRATIGITVMEAHSLATGEAKKDFIRHFSDPTGGRITLAVAPHAIYTVGADKFKDAVRFARENGLKIHTHLSETRKEVDDCLREHGTTPVRYLDSLGVLGPDVIAAHCVHVDEEEWDILAERGVSVAHCPCSNMKLGSGRFPYELAVRSGVRIALGTDSVSSNNCLDMREEMKFAALLAKVAGDPELVPAEQVLEWATKNGAEALGLNAGVIAPGKLADFLLLDLSNIRMQPCHSLVSNWVYAADPTCISDVYCDGVKIG